MRILVANLVIALLAAGLPGCSTNANIPKAEIAQEPCGRDCLEGLAGQYLQSLAAQDPSRLPITDDFQLVENNQPLKPGEGTWRTVNGLGAYRHYFPDLQTGSVAAITVVKENGTLAILDLLLETENRRIRKAEVMIIRDSGGAARYEKLGEPLPIFRQTVPLENRTSRADMIAAANKYFSGMENNEPKGDYSFFADDCNRLEHALQTTNMPKQTYGHSDDSDFVTLTCKAQFETGFLGFVTRIRDRRFVAVDEERQALFAFTNLDHHGAIRSINMSNGKVFKVPSYFSTSRTLQVGEAFQIDKGKIRQIEMTLTEIPYGSRPGWPAADYNPATPPPAGPQPPAAGAGPCDRKCLGGLAGQLLTAMVAHDASRAPLSPSARYYENGQRVSFDDGLWKTITGLGGYRVHVLDSDAGRIGFLGAITETDVSGVLTLNLKVENQQIQEIHAAAVREEKPGRSGTMTLHRPRLLAEFDPAHFAKPDPALLESIPNEERPTAGQAAAIVSSYFEGTTLGRAGAIPFDAACDRYDNGVRTTNNPQAPALDSNAAAFRPFSLGCAGQADSGFYKYVSKVRDPGPWIVDPELGLVFGIAYADVAGAVKSLDVAGVGNVALPSSFGVPHTLITPYLFKIRNGKIRRIETWSRPAPYGMAPRAGE